MGLPWLFVDAADAAHHSIPKQGMLLAARLPKEIQQGRGFGSGGVIAALASVQIDPRDNLVNLRFIIFVRILAPQIHCHCLIIASSRLRGRTRSIRQLPVGLHPIAKGQPIA